MLIGIWFRIRVFLSCVVSIDKAECLSCISVVCQLYVVYSLLIYVLSYVICVVVS